MHAKRGGLQIGGRAAWRPKQKLLLNSRQRRRRQQQVYYRLPWYLEWKIFLRVERSTEGYCSKPRRGKLFSFHRRANLLFCCDSNDNNGLGVWQFSCGCSYVTSRCLCFRWKRFGPGWRYVSRDSMRLEFMTLSWSYARAVWLNVQKAVAQI